MSIPKIDPSWSAALQAEFAAPYMHDLHVFLQRELDAKKHIYPPMPQVFEALNAVPLPEVKAVLIGQDPYHRPGQAHGLSFSVQPGVRIPPSLKNVYKELYTDLGIPPAHHGCLYDWAREGVLLLNNALTVEEGHPGAHRNRGWETFTNAVVRAISDHAPPSVFLLWGKDAKEKLPHIDATRHLVLATSHPSPMGNACNLGFFGSRPFSRTNTFLEAHGRTPIDWHIQPLSSVG